MWLRTLEDYLVACRMLAVMEALAVVTGVVDKRGGYEIRRIAPALLLSSRVDGGGWDSHRLYWRGTLVLDGDVGEAGVELRRLVRGGWIATCRHLDLAWRTGMRTPPGRAPCARRIARPQPGRRVPICRTERSRRRAAIVALAAAVAAHGEGVAGDPSARSRRIDGRVVAVALVGPHVSLSAHAADGRRILTATLERVAPWHVLETSGCRSVAAAGLLLAAAGSVEADDEVAFRAYCERRA